MDRSDKPIVAVATSGVDGMVAAERAAAVHDRVVLVAEEGTQAPPGTVAVRTDRGKATIGRAVREAADRDSWWVIVPTSLGDPEYLLGSAVRSVAKVVDAEHPGVALLVAAPGTRWPYRRVLVVVEPLGAAASGLAVWVTVALAHHTGAQVDVLAVGVPDGAPMGSRQARLSYVPIERRTDLMRLALERLDELAIKPRWIAGGAGVSAVDALEAVINGGDYDVVVDDLGGTRIRKRLGKRRSVKRLLADGEGGAVPLWALRNSGCDVVTVIDAVALGMLPAGVLGTGAVAAMTLGMLVPAAPALAAPSTSQSASPVTAVADPGAADTANETDEAGKQAEVGKQADADEVDVQLAAAHDWVHALGDEVSVDDHDLAMDTLASVQQDAEKADKQLKASRADLDRAESEVAEAQQSLDAAIHETAPVEQSMVEASAGLTEANAALSDALQEYDAVQSDASGVSGLLPGGASDEDVVAAQAAVADASSAVAQAHATQVERYAEYQEFAASIDEAEAVLAEANDDLTTSKKKVTQARAEAEAADELATGYEHLATEVDEAFRSQGLVAPATGAVTSEYGNRVHPVTGEYKLHTGTDFEGTDGNYYAAMDGTVSYAGYDSAYGNMVKIDHGKIEGHHVETWYAHQPDLDVNVGQDVSAGEHIGDIGSTGYSTGPHAHFELRVDGNPIDPMPYMR